MSGTSKQQLRILEKIFLAEIEDRLPCQFMRKSQLAEVEVLVRENLIAPMTITLPGRFPVEVSGHQLTHAGRFLYCSQC